MKPRCAFVSLATALTDRAWPLRHWLCFNSSKLEQHNLRSGVCLGLGLSGPALGLVEPVALAVHFEDVT